MLDQACIFTTSGVQLFYKAFCEMKNELINEFIKNTLIREKFESSCVLMNGQFFNWKISEECGLIFLVVYQELYRNDKVNKEMLDTMAKEYTKNYYPEILQKDGIIIYSEDFEKQFNKIVAAQEKKYAEIKPVKNGRKPKSPKKKTRETDNRSSDQKSSSNDGSDLKEKQTKTVSASQKNVGNNGLTISNNEIEDSQNIEETPHYSQSMSLPKNNLTAAQKAKLRNKKQNEQTKSLKVPNGDSQQEGVKEQNGTNSAKKSVKKRTTWETNAKVNSKTMAQLDFSNRTDNGKDVNSQTIKQEYFESDGKDELDVSFELESDDENTINEKTIKKNGLLSRFTTAIKSVTGNLVLSEQDLEPVMNTFKEDLMGKNVAEEIARQICDSIKQKLLNKETASFTSITKTVKLAFEQTLTKILTPKKNINIISDALKCREQGRPYVAVFIGVNGVGKSTNLAKVAYLFKSNGFSVMLAACDNFRAGAIEQIQTHGRCLDIPCFQRGYKDDPANIASDAIIEARKRKIDVVLVDTAGRMQDNEPLMKSQSRLVNKNQPDLVTFIGEALVGNDGVDQLTKFNKALIELAPDTTKVREIDAILISKFDTVDEKVGAAISMTHATGKPIIFVGTGQKYPNLKKMNIPFVVKMLLS